ncbi:MAG: CoA-binding protein, partial [Micrococcales bacterium]|nr:CoA-binding protein [Micrococcales bacterium]
MLNPTSLAVVGDARLGARVLRQTRALGFAGPAWAVHPSGQVGSEPALTSVADLPGSPDAAFVAVPAALAPGVLGELRDRGCGSAVVYSSGFAETGAAGLVLQQRLLEAADGMPILGPNCYGLLDYVDGVAIWPDEHGGQRLPAGGHGVAVVSQSSSMAISMTMQDIGLPLAHVLTVGNGAAVGPWQLAEALTAQPRVSAVGLVVESLHDLIGIEALARSSRATSTPVVVLLLGRSEQAQRVVLSHSASMASDAEVGAGFLARCGLGQVDSVDSLLGALALLHCGGPLAGPRLTSLSSSGGEAALVADACVGRRVGFEELSPTHRAALAAALGPRVTLDNPLDYHTYVWGDLTAMRAAFVAMTGGPGDLHLLFSDMPREDRCDPTDWLLAVQAFRDALEETGARGALVAAMGSNLRGPRPASWIERGLPVLAPVRVAIDAAQAAADIGAAWTRAVPEPVWGRGSVDVPRLLTAKPAIK